MPVPGVTVTVVDGGLSILSDPSDQSVCVIGTCSTGVVGQAYVFGPGATAASIKATVGAGKACELLAYLCNVPGRGPVCFIPSTQSAAGSQTVPVLTGTSPAMTTTGTALDDDEGRVEIVTGGALGTGTFRVSRDNGRTWQGPFTLAATYAVPDAGYTLAFAAGTYVAGDYWTFTATAPATDATAAAAAVDVLKSSGVEVAWVHFIMQGTGASDLLRCGAAATLAAALKTKIAELEGPTIGRFVGYSFDGALPLDGTTPAGRGSFRTQWGTAFASFSDKRASCAAYRCRITSPLPGFRSSTRPFMWAVLGRIGSSKPGTSLYRVRSGPLFGVTWIECDESIEGGADALRLSAPRTHPRRAGYFINRGRQLADVGSDFEETQILRVANLVSAPAFDALVDYLGDDVLTDPDTGKIKESEAAAVDSDLTSKIQTAAAGEASAVKGKISRTDNIASTGQLSCEAVFVPKGYIKKIVLTIGAAKVV